MNNLNSVVGTATLSTTVIKYYCAACIHQCFPEYIYIYIYIYIFGQVAQWLERVHGKHEVVGSNPTRPTFYMESKNLSSI